VFVSISRKTGPPIRCYDRPMKVLSFVSLFSLVTWVGLSSVAHGQTASAPGASGPYPQYPPPANQYRPASAPYPGNNVWMPPQGVHTHDGTYVRLQLGFGYNSMSSNSSGIDLELSGGGGAFLIAVGGAVSRNLVLYGTFADSIASNPEVKLNGQVAGTGTGRSSAGVVGIGPGLAYYFDPSNFYLSGTVLFSKLNVNSSNGDSLAQSDWGITGEGQFGKEWWVSDNWGLGCAVQGMLGKMKDKATTGSTYTPTWTFSSFSLLFSATYN
jgi:hypothetical protein